MSEVLDILECPLCLHKLGNTLRSCDNRVICASCKHTWSLLPKDEVQVLRARLAEANAELDLVRYTNPNQIGYVLLWISGTISEIHKVATKAREKHSVKNHHCELRAAIDSIRDRSKQDMAGLLECGKLYRTHELRTIEELREKLAEATARAERAEGALEAIREHCQSRHDFAQAAIKEAGNEQDRGHYRGQRDSLGLVLDKLDRALTPTSQRSDGERLAHQEVNNEKVGDLVDKLEGYRKCLDVIVKTQCGGLTEYESYHLHPLLCRCIDQLQFLQWLLANCKIIHWPGGGHYPIEHAPAANKDSVWLLKMAMGKQGMYAHELYKSRGGEDGPSQICGLCDKPKPCNCLMELESDATSNAKEGGEG